MSIASSRHLGLFNSLRAVGFDLGSPVRQVPSRMVQGRVHSRMSSVSGLEGKAPGWRIVFILHIPHGSSDLFDHFWLSVFSLARMAASITRGLLSVFSERCLQTALVSLGKAASSVSGAGMKGIFGLIRPSIPMATGPTSCYIGTPLFSASNAIFIDKMIFFTARKGVRSVFDELCCPRFSVKIKGGLVDIKETL